MEQVSLKATKRGDTGSGNARRARAEGRIPAIVYGHGKQAMPIAVDDMEFNRLISHHSLTSVINLDMNDDAGKTTVMVKEIQKDPVKSDILHIDFQEISLTETVSMAVPVVTVGTQINDGGIVEHTLNEVTVEAVVTNIPTHIEADIDGLKSGDTVHVSDLKVPEGVSIVDDPDQLVLSISIPKTVLETDEEEEEAEEAISIGEASPEAENEEAE